MRNTYFFLSFHLQAPIMDNEKKSSAGFLSSLMPDIQPTVSRAKPTQTPPNSAIIETSKPHGNSSFQPKYLSTNSCLKNANLWMTINGSRSSIHYDPFHNLLCPIVGTKTGLFLSTRNHSNDDTTTHQFPGNSLPFSHTLASQQHC